MTDTTDTTETAGNGDGAERAAAAPTAAAAPAAAAEARTARKVREGTVISDKMEKTVVVAVVERVRHPKYGKFMLRTKKLYAHDESGAAAGDKVRVMETRPLSKSKRWRVVEILERAK